MVPTFRTATAHRWCLSRSMRRSFPWLRHHLRRWRLCRTQAARRLDDKLGDWTLGDRQAIRCTPRASRSSRGAGSWSGPSLGSGAAEDWPRTGKNPSPARKPGSSLPTSASSPGASQGIVMSRKVSSQTLRPVVFAEVGDRLVIGHQSAGQPHDLYVAARLTL